MTTLRRALLAAFKSFIRGRSFLQALFALWSSPNSIKERHATNTTATAGTNGHATARPPPRSVEDFLREAEERLLGPIDGDGLRRFADGLKAQFRERLQICGENMLPSFNHLLPTGQETGQYLALDVGGSTLRVALVELRGRAASGREAEIVQISTFKITPDVKELEGMAFFDWLATRIHEVLSKEPRATQGPMPMGLAWSFPVEQTSLGGGLLLGMGKGFLATKGLLGQDLGELIKFACRKQGLEVELGAIVNDGTAALLSQAYVHASTHFGLILGTGSNIAVHLPVSALNRSKYGGRPAGWFERATHVIVNTEVSMFGKGVLPLTRWDELLNAAHPRPDFQPLEHCCSGFYLGEICRLALLEAIESTGVLGGQVPPSLEKPYSLDTETLSRIEADTTPTLEAATAYFASKHPCPSSPHRPTASDTAFVRDLASLITRRAAALLAAAVFALWELRRETEAEHRGDAADADADADANVEQTAATKVAFNGSVIEHYPRYRANCQQYLDGLLLRQGGAAVHLVPAVESSLLGAAVALASAVGSNA
ncbi:N-acetylglucosamine kinase 1 [Diatrype stigma]|uniref:Phosphotransferase n=1 Tax=Diatrype stigma TaxID=117547 RepID=A0AAN9UWI0_9PEZI